MPSLGPRLEVLTIVILELLRRQVLQIGDVIARVQHVPGDRVFHQGAVDAVGTPEIENVYGSALDLIPRLNQLHENGVRQMRNGIIQRAEDAIVHPRVSLNVELAESPLCSVW